VRISGCIHEMSNPFVLVNCSSAGPLCWRMFPAVISLHQLLQAANRAYKENASTDRLPPSRCSMPKETCAVISTAVNRICMARDMGQH
jgi:hypothetical protein